MSAEKITICHNVLHNPHEITVSVNALGAHEAHLLGTDEFELDVYGPCPTPTTTTTQPEVIPPVVIPPEVPTTTTPTTGPAVDTATLPEEAPHVVCKADGGFEFKQAPGPCPEALEGSVEVPQPQPIATLPVTGFDWGAVVIFALILSIIGLLVRSASASRRLDTRRSR